MPSKATTSSGQSSWRTWVIPVVAVGLSDLTDRARSQEPTTSVVVHAKRYAFVPSAITLKKGQTVKLILISDDVLHGFVVKGLGIRSDMLPGQRAEVMITPSQVGDFPGTCSVYCGSGHKAMEFVVHVVE
jgi:cytochrome c oxidase subunit 2